MAAEGAREADPVHGGHAHLIHQQLDAGVERCFGELNLANVILGDEHIRYFGIARCVQDIREGAAVGFNALMKEAAEKRKKARAKKKAKDKKN